MMEQLLCAIGAMKFRRPKDFAGIPLCLLVVVMIIINNTFFPLKTCMSCYLSKSHIER